MKKLAVCVCLCILHLAVLAQDKPDVVGTWKIVVFDAAVYHDYKKDSTSIPQNLRDELKGDKDSSFVVGFLTGMVSAFDNYYYVFQADGQYKELKGDKLKQQGSYTISGSKGELILIAKDKTGGENKQTLLYQLKNDRLLLKVPSEEKVIKFELERVR